MNETSESIDPAQALRILEIVHAQVSTALWLSAGMVLAAGAMACTALAWRKAALAFGCLYGVSLCFVHNGHAQILGPLVCATCLAGAALQPRSRS